MSALAYVSAALTAICVVPYLRDIHRGTTRPQRVSWLVFATLSIVAAASQFAAGSDAGAWLAVGSATGFTAVFVASIRHGEGGFSAWDRCALVVAFVGVVLSIVVHRPVVAVVAVIAAELFAVALTARKARRDPASETASTWLIDCAAGMVAIAAITNVSFTELLYPLHHTLVNAWVLLTIARGRAARRQTHACVPRRGGGRGRARATRSSSTNESISA